MMNKRDFDGMKSFAAVLFAGLSVAASAAPGTLVVAADSVPNNRYVMFDAAVSPADAKIVWEWKPSADPRLTPQEAKWFHAPDECKVIDGGRTLLVCASGAGFAEIDIATARPRVYGRVHAENAPYGNPHSIERLPDGRYAFASSEGPGGDSVTLIDVTGAALEPGRQKRVRAATVYRAHGVEWDAERQSLWVLGKTNLAEFAYHSDTMSLTEKRSFSLPGAPATYGHDLSWAMDGKLLVTTPVKGGHRVFSVDRETGTFADTKISQEEIKSISFNRAGDVVLMATDPGSCRFTWQSNRIRFGKSGDSVLNKGPYPWAAFYKVRFAEASAR